MNDMQIYAQVAKKPGIRASEIAVNLDLTLATVSADLRSLVDTGDLVKRTEFGDQGRQWQVYELSEEFKASRTYKALMETLASTVEPVPVKTGTKVDLAQPGAAPPAGPQPGPSVSKVQLALACIAKLGSATDDQLRDAMGLLPKAYVGAYLASAIKSGKVLRDGERWKLGAGKVEARVPDSATVQPVSPIKTAVVDDVFISSRDASKFEAVVDAIAAASALVGYRPLAQPPNLRCALWSDGTFELQRNGEEVARLAEDELEFVRDYLAQRAAA